MDDAADVDTARLRAIGVEYRLGGELVSMTGVTALVKSPGAPGDHPLVASARDAGVPVWSEVELGYRLIRSPIIGITGTNGKTTTTELVAAMLRAGSVPVEVAGNVGRPLCDLAGRVDPATWVACELSSFQLEDIDSFRARVGVVLQVTPDHLDRHGTFAEYLSSKLRLFENQTAEDTAVLNADDPVLREAEIPGAGRRVWFEPRRAPTGSTGNIRRSVATITSKTRWPRLRRRRPSACPGRRATARSARSLPRRTGCRRWRCARASASSTTQRPRTRRR